MMIKAMVILSNAIQYYTMLMQIVSNDNAELCQVMLMLSNTNAKSK